MAPENLTLANIHSFAGCELGVSEWQTLDQQRIDRFAECTGDVGRARHRGASIIGFSVSFLDLSFERTGPGWSRAGATGQQRPVGGSPQLRAERTVPFSIPVR
jgi:hypothetical protein